MRSWATESVAIRLGETVVNSAVVDFPDPARLMSFAWRWGMFRKFAFAGYAVDFLPLFQHAGTRCTVDQETRNSTR